MASQSPDQPPKVFWELPEISEWALFLKKKTIHVSFQL